MLISPVFILDKDQTAGAWVLNHLREIRISAQWMSTASELINASEHHAPSVCLIALRSPVAQAFALIKDLIQEPRFADTAFVPMGPVQFKRAAFEAGAEDYIITPPDVIELRKRVRLFLERADWRSRHISETRLSQEIDELGQQEANQPTDPDSPITLLEHVAAITCERDRFEQVLNCAGEAIIVVAPDGTLLYTNPAWERLSGHDIKSLPRIPWPPNNNELVHSLNEGKSWRGEVTYTFNGNQPRDLDMMITPTFTPNGEIEAFVVVPHDISMRKALDLLRTQFLTDAAMEMRTPVTNIKMRQYLLRQAPPEQRGMHLQAFERETERLSRLVDAMLELARLDSHQVHFARETLDLNRLAGEAVVRFSQPAEDHGVTLGFTRNETLPTFSGDSAQLARVMGILLDNAILYTPEGGHIEVSLKDEGWSGGQFVTVQISDTGIGIIPEDLPHVFDRFFRSERVRDSAIRGVGLGLAIAREIVNRHNGEITVESSPNEGSTFTVWLPVN